MLLAACTGAGVSGQYAAPVAEVLFPDKTRVRVEIADTEAKRARGLMFRKHLAGNEGMIFLFEQPGHYPFWMQNCRIALDIVWLDPRFKVVSIAESVPPCRLPKCEPPCASTDCPSYPPAPGTSAKYVVELAAGFSKRHGLKTGNTLDVQLPKR
jgi:hypothetical protein